MSTLKTHNLQSPDAGSVNIVMAPNAGMVVAGLSTYSNQINVGNNIKLGTAGVVTATSFVGSGANLTSLPTQVTISNNGYDRIITGGSGTNLNGEANLQFDGTDLYVSDNIKHLGDPDTLIEFATDQITFDTGGGERIRIDAGGLRVNKTTTSDYGRFEVKGPTADDILTGDIRTKTVATFSGGSPGTTAAGKGAGIVIKPITDRGCHYFFGVANSSANQEAQGTFVIRSGHLASATAERLRIASDGKITPTEGVIIPDDKQLSIGNDADLYIKYSAAHGNNFIVSSNGDVEHHMSLSKKIIKGFDNSGTPYVSLYYNDTARITTTNDGITFGGEVTFSSGQNVRTFAGTAYLADGAYVDIVQHTSGYAWSFFEFFCISYHGSIGRAYWKGAMARYNGDDNYTLSNNMGYCNLERSGSSSSNNHPIRIQRTGTYGTVQYNYYIRCYAANSTATWAAMNNVTQKYLGN